MLVDGGGLGSGGLGEVRDCELGGLLGLGEGGAQSAADAAEDAGLGLGVIVFDAISSIVFQFH